MMEKYPGRNGADPSDAYASYWLGYVCAFEVVLSAWEEGDFTATGPGFPLPFMGLMTCLK